MEIISKKINKKLINEEEDENDLIINNDDDFCGENEQISPQKNNLKIKVEYNKGKENEFLSSQKIEITGESRNNEITTNKNIFIPVPNFKSTNESVKEQIGEEKTIFSKITEDLYLFNKFYLKPQKICLDIAKANEDNYNKLTIENYLFTCADKENSKNNKIISDFLERKTREQNNKKIGSDPEKDDSENFMEIRGLYSDRKINRKEKRNIRSPEQFLKEQKDLEKKHYNYMESLVKKYNDEAKNVIKDKPTINKQSEKLANKKKSGNKDIHEKLYEEYNLKMKRIEEKIKKEIDLNENNNKKMKKEEVMKNVKRLYQDYKNRINNYNENNIKNLNDIKNRSMVSLIEKKSNVIINKKLISDYKNTIKTLFNKNISDKFDMNFNDYLLFLFKLGLIDKEYNIKNIKEGKNKNFSNLNISPKNNLIKNIDNFDTERYNNDNIINKILFSKNILKKNACFKSKSVEKNEVSEEFESKIIKNSWKIITKNKNFSEKDKGYSRRILLFILSVYGIYNGDIDIDLIKKEFRFLTQDEDKSYNIDTNLAKQIYKYFYTFRNTAINNISLKNKEKEQNTENRAMNNIRYKKYKLSKDSGIKTIEYNTNINENNKNINKNYSSSITSQRLYINKNLKNNSFNIKNININNVSEMNKKNIKDVKIIENYNNKIYNNKENNLCKNLCQNKELIINNKIYLKKGINSSSAKNVNCNINKNIISYENSRSNKNNKKENINLNIDKSLDNPKNNIKLKTKKIKNISSPKIINKKQNKNINPNSILNKEKGKSFSNNKNSNEQKTQKINENINNEDEKQSQTNESKHDKKPKIDIQKHQKEKNSSISNYIFQEDYRIKEDIESNSNFNNLEVSENKGKIISQNFSESDYPIEKSEVSKKNMNSNDIIVKDEQNKIDEKKNEEKNEEKKKRKFVFKIKVKNKFIKLIVNKGDDIESKTNAFCKENDLDDDDKEEILEAINNNLN